MSENHLLLIHTCDLIQMQRKYEVMEEGNNILSSQ